MTLMVPSKKNNNEAKIDVQIQMHKKNQNEQ